MHRSLSLLAALCLALPLGAQGTPTAADSALMRALDLPRIMQRARAAGVPDSSVRGILGEMRRRGIPAAEAEPALEMEVDAVEAGGRPDNFGAFVRSQVEAGYRGRELAERIRAEHQARGMGPAGRRGRPAGAGRQGGDSSAAAGKAPTKGPRRP